MADDHSTIGANEAHWTIDQLLEALEFLDALLPPWHIVVVVAELANSGRIRTFGRRCDETGYPKENGEVIPLAEWTDLELRPPPMFGAHPGELRRRSTGQRAWADVELSLPDLMREWLGTIFATRRYALPAGITIPPHIPPPWDPKNPWTPSSPRPPTPAAVSQAPGGSAPRAIAPKPAPAQSALSLSSPVSELTAPSAAAPSSAAQKPKQRRRRLNTARDTVRGKMRKAGFAKVKSMSAEQWAAEFGTSVSTARRAYNEEFRDNLSRAEPETHKE